MRISDWSSDVCSSDLFEPGAQLYVSLCASPPGDPANRFACGSSQSGEERIDDDGAFAIEYEIPRIDDQGYPGTTTCEERGCGDGSGAATSRATASRWCAPSTSRRTPMAAPAWRQIGRAHV